MKKSVMKKWVAALRSGKYKQGKGYLRDKDNNYCCLGVLCAISKVKAVKADKHYYFMNKYTTLPRKVMELAGIKDCGGKIQKSNISLWKLNDIGIQGLDRFTFEEIADIIELEYKNL